MSCTGTITISVTPMTKTNGAVPCVPALSIHVYRNTVQYLERKTGGSESTILNRINPGGAQVQTKRPGAGNVLTTLSKSARNTGLPERRLPS